MLAKIPINSIDGTMMVLASEPGSCYNFAMAVKKRKISTRDPKKESVYKELARALAENGFTVRREKLKQGSGWRVMSGQCMVKSEGLIFVDSRMTQDDQIAFLQGKLAALGASATPGDAVSTSETSILSQNRTGAENAEAISASSAES